MGGRARRVRHGTRHQRAAGATVGRDAQPYLERLSELNINRRFVRQLDDRYTAQAVITTDADNIVKAVKRGAELLAGK